MSDVTDLLLTFERLKGVIFSSKACLRRLLLMGVEASNILVNFETL